MKGFENIIGYEDIKEELCQITDILQNSERYRKLGVTKPAGVLLHEVPGVGKTLMVKSLADASGRKVFYCRKDEPDGDFIRTLKDVFTKAGNEAPSVIILDDMDKYADVNRYDQDAEEYVTIQSCIDDAKDKDVFVAATANSIYPFPRSLLRPGRFDRIIEVEVPRGKDAESIVAHYIKEKAFVDDIDARTIARIMDGRSCAELEKVINEAGIFAGYQNSDKITMNHFLEACMRTVFHAPACSVPGSDEEDFSFLTETLMNYCNESRLLPQVICHEAGHAVLSEILCPGSVTLVSSYSKGGDEGGFTSCYHDESIDNYRWTESRILCCLGGMAAVEQNYGAIGIGASSDLDQAFQYVQALVTSECVCGFSLHSLRGRDSAALRARQEQAVASEVERYYRKAKQLLAANDSFFRTIVHALGEKKLLTAPDIKKIRERCNIQPAV